MADPTSTEQPQTPATPAPSAPQTGDSTGPNAGEPEKRFTQAELEFQLNERLTRERTKAAEKAAKEKADLDAQALKEQEKFKELADRHEARVKEIEPQLETLTAERDALRDHLAAVVTAETKDWPKEVKDLLPETDDVLVKFEAVARTRALAARLSGTAPAPGNGPNPRPTGSAGQVGINDIIEQKRAKGVYQPF